MYDPPLVGAPLQVGTLIKVFFLDKTSINVVKTVTGLRSTSKITYIHSHCLDRTPDCTFLGTGSLLTRLRTGKPARGRYIFYNHFISILIVIQYQRPDLRTLYAFLQSSLVSLSQKSHRYGYGGIISSPFFIF